jgi:hypothetical protein
MHKIARLVPAIFFVGCATVNHGPLQRISVDSDVPATVTVEKCGVRFEPSETPTEVFVSRRATDCVIVLTTDREERVVPLTRHAENIWDTVEAADVVLSGASTIDEVGIGLVAAVPVVLASAGVDFATGAVYQQQPAEIFVSFLEEPSDEDLGPEPENWPDDEDEPTSEESAAEPLAENPDDAQSESP